MSLHVIEGKKSQLPNATELQIKSIVYVPFLTLRRPETTPRGSQKPSLQRGNYKSFMNPKSISTLMISPNFKEKPLSMLRISSKYIINLFFFFFLETVPLSYLPRIPNYTTGKKQEVSSHYTSVYSQEYSFTFHCITCFTGDDKNIVNQGENDYSYKRGGQTASHREP